VRIDRSQHGDEGFSLIELMTVVLIIGILVTVAVASFGISVERSRRITCLHNQRLMDSGIMQYQIMHEGHQPPALDDVEPYVQWSGPNFGTCASDPTLPFDYDPATGRVSCDNHPR